MKNLNRLCAAVSLLLISQTSLFSQDMGCDGSRYIDEVFTEVNVENGVPYGQASTLSGIGQLLTMNIFQPEGDLLEARPLIIAAHGGGFAGGSPEDLTSLCTAFAKRGYVCVSIGYRLMDVFPSDSTDLYEGVLMAVNDMRAAVRFFREDQSNDNIYKIAPEYIFAAGASAGAIMASHLGFMDDQDQVPPFLQTIIDSHGGFEGNSSNNTEYSSAVQGVLNYSGAIIRQSWVDSDDAPVYSAHDELDPVVACDYNISNLPNFPFYLYGSCSITAKADEHNVPNQFYLIEDSDGHVSYFQNSLELETVYNESAVFLEQIICGWNSISEISLLQPLEVFPNPSQGNFTFRNLDASGDETWQLINTAGRIVDAGTFIPGSGSEQTVHVEQAPGLYTFKVSSANSSRQIQITLE